VHAGDKIGLFTLDHLASVSARIELVAKAYSPISNRSLRGRWAAVSKFL
jgi:hypothetical protein